MSVQILQSAQWSEEVTKPIQRSRQYHESKVLHNTEVAWFSTALRSLNLNFGTNTAKFSDFLSNLFGSELAEMKI